MSRTLRFAAVTGAVAALAACSTSATRHAGPGQPSPPTSVSTRSTASSAPTPRSSTAVRSSSAAPTRPARTRVRRTTSEAPHRSLSPSQRRSTTTRSTRNHSTGTPSDALPLRYSTGNARQVITVTARSTTSTGAILQAWQRAGDGWRPSGPAVSAWLGAAGFSRPASEGSTATPQGSFSLTQAFGRDANPGTALPYTQTSSSDWWISQPGPLYNTMQHCSSGCAFAQGSPNEHLYYEIPYYNYAVVINYNRSPVVQGNGSAFFLHVAVGAPTQGCVSIDRDQLVRLLRWLKPSAHPRILLGTS